jgi:hypothetical protein
MIVLFILFAEREESVWGGERERGNSVQSYHVMLAVLAIQT